MHQSGDGMQFTHPPGVTLFDVDVAKEAGLPLIPEYHRLVPYPLIGGENHPALTTGDDLRGIERECPGHTERTRVAAVMARTMRMGGVLHQENATLVAQCPDVVDLGSDQPPDVDEDHRTRTGRERRGHGSGAQGKRLGVHIRKDQIRAGPQNREAGRRKRVRRHDDVCTRNIHGAENDLKSSRAAADRDGKRDTVSRGERRFELLRMRAERQRSTSQDLRRQGRDLRAIGFGEDDPRRWNLHLHTPFGPHHIGVHDRLRSGHCAERRYRFTCRKAVRIILARNTFHDPPLERRPEGRWVARE